MADALGSQGITPSEALQIAEFTATRMSERSAAVMERLVSEAHAALVEQFNADRRIHDEALLERFTAQQSLAYQTLRNGVGKIHDHLTRLTFQLELTHVQPAPEPSERSVLVADDEEMIRRLLVRCCRLIGLRVVEASNGEEARELLGKCPSLDVAVVDWAMPFNGHLVVDEIRTRYPSIPIVIASGYPIEAPPGVHLLPKPFGPSELIAMLKGLLPEL